MLPGSSPRGRGKPECVADALVTVGLIPAWAGKTSLRLPPRPRSRAHPRVGGENGEPCETQLTHTGSSPRGRGKPPKEAPCSTPTGLIPAWAGKTPGSSRARPLPRAHPRVGGENPGSLGTGIVGAGSSPRGRGKPVTVRMSLTVAVAHPRVGGENAGLLGSDAGTSGSSPRGRGKQHRGNHGCPVGGLIPAWAGKTLQGPTPG